jgi:hypothetical protein
MRTDWRQRGRGCERLRTDPGWLVHGCTGMRWLGLLLADEQLFSLLAQ